jgi:hypothetical protein
MTDMGVLKRGEGGDRNLPPVPLYERGTSIPEKYAKEGNDWILAPVSQYEIGSSE